MTTQEYIQKNKERNAEYSAVYDPITGEGSDTCDRLDFHVPDLVIEGKRAEHWKIPFDCFDEKIIADLNKIGSIRSYLKALKMRYTRSNVELVTREFIKARCRHDFEFVAAVYLKIKDKDPKVTTPIAFVLNRGQRKLLKMIYDDDKFHRPVRIFIVKSRQIGFSTEVDGYMFWKQVFVLKIARAEIIAHVESAARNVRGMYSMFLKYLPPWLLGFDDVEALKLVPFERGVKTLQIKELGCRVTIGSSKQPDGLAGEDVSMVHFSEVALFASTLNIKPQQLIQTVMGGVAYAPDTMVIYESTPRGVGNFFHTECLAAKNGESSNKLLYVPWFMMDKDRLPIDDYPAFIESMTTYEKWLFDQGATLEGIHWYREASKSMTDKWRWKSERSSSFDEAFQSTGHRLYPQDDVIRLRNGVRDPGFVGDIYGKKSFGEEAMEDIVFKEEREGPLKVWFKPDTNQSRRCNDRYVVVMDIGGASDHSDRSVICVIDRYDMCKGGVPIVVAEWCGHIDHDLLAWKAVQLATVYDNALLVIESNTLETEQTEGDHFDFILDEIAYYYDNLYCRVDAEKIKMGFDPKWGFHTNKSTKRMVCDHHKKVLRENMYIETCKEACDEHDFMEIKGNNSIGAVDGQHDDRHITRAIGIWVCYDYLNAPRALSDRSNMVRKPRRLINESSF